MAKKTAVMGNITTDFLAESIKKLGFDVYNCGYDCYSLEMLNEESGFRRFGADVTLLYLDGSELVNRYGFQEAKNHLTEIWNNFEKKCKGYLIISTLHIQNGINSVLNFNTKENFKKNQYNLNLFLNSMAEKNSRLFILDTLSLLEKYGSRSMYDSALWHFGNIRLNSLGNSLVAEEFSQLVAAIYNEKKKCIVTDLDNTLWGGIIGEDGINRIELGKTKNGKIYKNVQAMLKKISEKGVLLAVCSKNNETDVLNVFENHSEMVLKKEDFTVMEINWDEKPENIKKITGKLNLGEDSLVFIDDSRFEREMVKSRTEATVPEFPENIEDYEEFIVSLDKKYFSSFALTDEDKRKSEQYRENIKRSSLEKEYATADDYIRSLGLKLAIKKYSEDRLARIAQLTQKTNQFNLTTRRYSEADIKEMINDGWHIYTGEAVDKFGDYGIVLLLMIKKEKEKLKIDTLLMSCRAIGRKLENAFVYSVLKNYTEKNIYSEYIPTAKNSQVENLYENLGFTHVETDNNGRKTYLVCSDNLKEPGDYVEVICE